MWILEVRSEKGCGKWHFLVWNRVRIWGTRRHTPTENYPEYPLGCETAVSFSNFLIGKLRKRFCDYFIVVYVRGEQMRLKWDLWSPCKATLDQCVGRSIHFLSVSWDQGNLFCAFLPYFSYVLILSFSAASSLFCSLTKLWETRLFLQSLMLNIIPASENSYYCLIPAHDMGKTGILLIPPPPGRTC